MTPAQHLARISALFPKFWQQYDRFRTDAATLGGWPPYCYCPLAGAYAIVSGGGDNRIPISRTHLVGELGAVAAWRPTKGIYRFDPDLAQALASTPLERDLPPGILERLPEWCVWVDPSAGLPGFFAYIEHDAGDRRNELRLAIDIDEKLVQVIVHLDRGSLRDGIDAAHDEAAAQAALHFRMAVPPIPESSATVAAKLAAPLVSLLLYLCADEPDFGTRAQPEHPSQKRRATGAQGETVWTVGERIGAALRAASTEYGEQLGGSHSSPRAHVRRAHWHTYWTGPRTNQVARCRWLAPILVGSGETIPTGHAVNEEKSTDN